MRGAWFLRGWRKYVTAVVLIGDLTLGSYSAAMAVTTAAPAAASSATTSSAVMVKWSEGRTLDPTDKNQPLFSNLAVTVSQTEDLTDQGLRVSWTGGTPTKSTGAPGDYLQIMQCWASKGAAGPTPEQCQWGAPNAALSSQMGLAAASRSLLTGAQADPAELPNGTCTADHTHSQTHQRAGCLVPFWSIDDPNKTALGWMNDQYNLPPFGAAQSNEASFVRTAADGTGQYIFNLQSALTSPYLGCGDPAAAAAGDRCYLVVVPRGEYNLNGELAADEAQDSGYGSNYNYVAGSPLSAGAWRNRIQIPLTFSPIGTSCRLGASTVRTAGTELAAGAFASWQAALCGQGATLGYSEITDSQARTALTAGGTAMNFLSNKPDAADTAGATIQYAPVATSGIVISYLIDKNYRPDKSNPDLGANGTLVDDLRLTPLLVAKLLTQSYRSDTPGDGHGAGATVPASNPDSLLQDPDFLALNPDFKYFYPTQTPEGLIVPFGDTDSAMKVWAWLRSDPQAKSFLAGNEVDGATINGAYKALNLATDATVSSFPKNDASTFRTGDWPAPGYGTLDMRPYATDFGNAAVRTYTANAGLKTTWDTTLSPPQATSSGPQVPGNRFELAITTSEAAALSGLPTAALVSSPTDTSAGVTPTSTALAEGLAGVPGGYPLTMQTYAAINVCQTGLSDLTADAAFLEYAAGAGQAQGTKLGQLPPGYAPLTAEQKAQASAAAAGLRAEVKNPQCASHKAAPPVTTPPAGTGTTGGGGAGTIPSGPGAGGTVPGVPGGSSVGAAPASDTGKAPAAAAASAELPGSVTPAASVAPAGQYALLAALCFFVPCAVFGPTLLARARRRA
ncbi:hypothetical protein LK09_10520 [Microbacterium mangrovi]|uniref:Uncharacterized protein n=1 Tax=Microbacterium mangrovi TaxID=1348253 RepID=A0A0B2A3K9_9MICO|nr:hypothetical protein [Microbacterium mangrovi]KHK97635.1 hypothetical protein LK09_10520 [Microbacterium mangrovi]